MNDQVLNRFQEAGARSPEDLVESIEAYCREDNRIRFYDYEINAILEKHVEQSPSAFLKLADRINQIGTGEIVSGLGYGLRKAVTGKKIERELDVADLLLRVARQLKSGELAFHDPESHWPIHAYIDLLREASRQSDSWRTVEVQKTLLEAAKAFIEVAAKGSGYISERQMDVSSDWLAHSLNSDHGLLGYAICFLASVAVEERDMIKDDPRLWLEQEKDALELLELVLNRQEPNYLRVAFGSLIPFMLLRRSDWFKRNWQAIFPEDDVLWTASWSSYILPRQRWDKVFFALEDQYIKSMVVTRSILDLGLDIRDSEWHRIPGEDLALFWQMGTIQHDNRVLLHLIKEAPDVLLDDVVDVLRHTIETEKAPVERAAELVKLIQDCRGSDIEGAKSYWSRLQVLFDHVPAHHWLGELRQSFDNCIQATDQIYVDLVAFLDGAFQIDPKATTDILFQIRLRANDVPWFFLWSRVRPLLEVWQQKLPAERQLSIESVLRTSRPHD